MAIAQQFGFEMKRAMYIRFRIFRYGKLTFP